MKQIEITRPSKEFLRKTNNFQRLTNMLDLRYDKDMLVTNRDLLRRYKELKEKLLTGEVKEIVIPQKTDIVLKITLERKKSSFGQLKDKIAKKPLPNLQRPSEDII